MKRFAAVGILVGLLAGSAQAGDLEHNVGIGLGTMIFQGHDGLVQQVLAATTNGIFGNQTFAISSGTLGARQPESLVKNEELRHFVADNLDSLAQDIARGRGETLVAVADLMGVPKAKRAAFDKKLQKNFSTIFPSAEVTHIQVLQNIQKVLAG